MPALSRPELVHILWAVERIILVYFTTINSIYLAFSILAFFRLLAYRRRM